MRRFLVLVILLLFFGFSSNYSLAQNTLIGWVDPRDKECLEAIEKAKKDFAVREIYYELYTDADLAPFATYHIEFMAQVLKEKDITYGRDYSEEFSVLDDKGIIYMSRTSCYSETSNKLIALKYGDGFAKSTIRKADSLYIVNNRDKIFKVEWEIAPYPIIYPNASSMYLWDQHKEVNVDFNKCFKYPKRFHRSGGKDFEAFIEIIIKDDATIVINNVDLKFENPENEKFRKRILKQMKEFVLHAKWQAATINGFKVNCSTHFFLENRPSN